MRRDEGEAPRRLRRAEAVLKRRTSRLVLVCENCFDEHNIAAILRTAEAFGVQHVYLIREEKKDNSQESAVSLGAEYWINIHEFENTASCIESLENDGFDIWATDLNPGAVELCSIIKSSDIMNVHLLSVLYHNNLSFLLKVEAPVNPCLPAD